MDVVCAKGYRGLKRHDAILPALAVPAEIAAYLDQQLWREGDQAGYGHLFVLRDLLSGDSRLVKEIGGVDCDG